MEDTHRPNRPIRFSVNQVKELLGGKFPFAKGFAWDQVEYFLLENGAFEPYRNGDILPGPRLIARCYQAIDPTDPGSVTLPEGIYYFTGFDNTYGERYQYFIKTIGGDRYEIPNLTHELAVDVADLLNVARAAALMEGGIKKMA